EVGFPQCQLFFDPQEIEGSWERNHPGGMIGYSTCLTASIAQQLMLHPEKPDIKQGILNGLETLRELHLKGYGPQGDNRQPVDASQAHLAFPIDVIAKSLMKTQCDVVNESLMKAQIDMTDESLMKTKKQSPFAEVKVQ